MRELQLLTQPVMYVANVDEAALTHDNAYLTARCANSARAEGATVVPGAPRLRPRSRNSRKRARDS